MKKIGITCGAFDLCHAGHMMMFKECQQVCDYLIVLLQTDPSTDSPEYRGKKKNKPIMSLEERYEILKGIKYVDEIVVYTNEADLYQQLKNIKYDVRIIGADWKGKKYTGWDLPHEIFYNSRNHGFSTSELRERVYAAEMKRLEEVSNPTQEVSRLREAFA
jgi:glycerol-3-phosphate cytidylyltransferase